MTFRKGNLNYGIYKKAEDGTFIIGTTLPVFVLLEIYDPDEAGCLYSLETLSIYQDGTIRCGYQHFNLQQLKQEIQEGKITVQIAESSKLEIASLGEFGIYPSLSYYKNNDDLIKEVIDIIDELNDRPDSSARCQIAWENYLTHPCAENIEYLRIAYEAIPTHHRKYVLGDMDQHDIPIRKVIYQEPLPLRYSIVQPEFQPAIQQFSKEIFDTSTPLEKFYKELKNLAGNQNIRPFVCNGNPLKTDILIIGFNPATQADDFWKYFAPATGFNKNDWLQAYQQDRKDAGKPALSNTRRVIEWINDALLSIHPNLVVMETNIYALPTRKKTDLTQSDQDTLIFDFLIQHLQPKVMITHGVDAERHIKSINLNTPVLAQKHFAIGWSRNKAQQLAQEILTFL